MAVTIFYILFVLYLPWKCEYAKCQSATCGVYVPNGRHIEEFLNTLLFSLFWLIHGKMNALKWVEEPTIRNLQKIVFV